MKYKLLRWMFRYIILFIDMFFEYGTMTGGKKIYAQVKGKPGIWHCGDTKWEARSNLISWILVGMEDL